MFLACYMFKLIDGVCSFSFPKHHVHHDHIPGFRLKLWTNACEDHFHTWIQILNSLKVFVMRLYRELGSIQDLDHDLNPMSWTNSTFLLSIFSPRGRRYMYLWSQQRQFSHRTAACPLGILTDRILKKMQLLKQNTLIYNHVWLATQLCQLLSLSPNI